MDLESLFWTAAAFYFIYRALGGGRRSSKSPQQSRPAPERPRAPERDELDAALGEIRQALGMPSSRKEVESEPTSSADRHEPHSPPPKTLPSREVPAPAREGGRRQDKPLPRRRQPASSSESIRTSTESKRVSSERLRPSMEPLPASTDPITTEPIGESPIGKELPPLRSSFSEEDMFERIGRHAHKKTRHDLRVVSPYEAPAKKKLPSVLRSLTGRSSMREAFLLKEILDRPLALRRR